MGNFFRGLIRASSFLQKEIFEILRQPRLIATLVVGPFLILLIFGIGYRAQTRPLRTLFVVQPDSPIAAGDIQQYMKSVDTLLIYTGVTASQSEALDQLQRGLVDLVIVEPVGVTNTIKTNQQAVIAFYHHEIDPVQVSYVNYMGWLYVGQVNQQVLRSFVVQGQKDAVNLRADLQEAHLNVSAIRQAINNGDEALAQQKQQELTNNENSVSQAAGASLGLLDGLQQTKGASGGGSSLAQTTLADLRQNTNQLMDTKGTNLNNISNYCGLMV